MLLWPVKASLRWFTKTMGPIMIRWPPCFAAGKKYFGFWAQIDPMAQTNQSTSLIRTVWLLMCTLISKSIWSNVARNDNVVLLPSTALIWTAEYDDESLLLLGAANTTTIQRENKRHFYSIFSLFVQGRKREREREVYPLETLFVSVCTAISSRTSKYFSNLTKQ